MTQEQNNRQGDRGSSHHSRCWFTSDTHFGHGNIIKYCLRPFFPPEGMHLYQQASKPTRTTEDTEKWRRYRLPQEAVIRHDDALVNNWNSVVGEQDVVYHLGDFHFGSEEHGIDILDRLHGHVRHINGNHDKKLRPSVRRRFDWSRDYYELSMPDEDVPGGRVHINLSHYLMLNFNKQHHAAWMLFGHSHSNANAWVGRFLPEMRCLDAGVDSHNYTPWSYQEVKQHMLAKKGATVDHHGEE